MKTKMEPYKIHIADEQLADLRYRLEHTRWSGDLNNDDSYYGISTIYMQSLVHYWLHDHNWRETEKKLNEFKQFKAEVDGQPIHFIYEKGKGKNSIPIILAHGWPWTYWHWSKIIRSLTDPENNGGDPSLSFDVIVPSLPGFGFSTPLSDGKMNFSGMADLFNSLMVDVLGYERYAAAGCDYGALVTSQLGHKYGNRIIRVHLGQTIPLTIFQNERPWDLTVGAMVPQDATDKQRNAILTFQKTYVSHVAAHMLDAQTITHGLNDSPVGMLAWIVQRWRKWSDQKGDFEHTFSKDDIVTFATIFWANHAIGSSIRAYPNAHRYPWQPSHKRTPQIEPPAGFTFLTGDASPPLATVENRVSLFLQSPLSKNYNIVYAKAHERGGHFGPWENPAAFIEGIRETFSIISKQ